MLLRSLVNYSNTHEFVFVFVNRLRVKLTDERSIVRTLYRFSFDNIDRNNSDYGRHAQFQFQCKSILASFPHTKLVMNFAVSLHF